MPMAGDEYEFRTVSGKWCKASSVIGYCHYIKHKGAITKTILKSHRCIEKQCFLFELMNPEYWTAIERAEEKKKEQIKAARARRKHEAWRDALIRSVFEPYKDIYITKIVQDDECLTVTYIYDRFTDLTMPLNLLRETFRCPVRLVAVRSSVDNRRVLIRERR